MKTILTLGMSSLFVSLCFFGELQKAATDLPATQTQQTVVIPVPAAYHPTPETDGPAANAAPAPESTGRLLSDTISDSDARTYINAYRSNAGTQTKYVSFTYTELVAYLNDQRNAMKKNGKSVKENEVGVRIYFSEKNGKNDMIVTLTYQGQAVWQNKVATALGLDNPNQFVAFDDGQICPLMCGTDDNNLSEIEP